MECLENLEACAEKRDKQEKVRNQTVRETQPFSPFWKLESKKLIVTTILENVISFKLAPNIGISG